MRKIYKSILTVAFLALSLSAANAAQVLVKSMPLGDGITGAGIVRLVVKVSPDAAGPDIGIILHEVDPWDGGWNSAMALMMFDFVKNTNEGLFLAGYDTDTWDWETNVKQVEAGKEVALWISVDAEGNTHGLAAQMEGETEVTTIYSGYGSRSFTKGNPSDNAKFCTVFANGRDGQTETAIDIIKDAEIVSSIEPYTFASTATADITLKPVSVYPTMVTGNISIKSNSAISNTKVYSLAGQVVLEAKNEKTISLSELSAGTYIVSVTTADGENFIQKVIKK